MMNIQPHKDISIRVRGCVREHLDAVHEAWPFNQPDLVAAAIYRFAKMPPEMQIADIKTMRQAFKAPAGTGVLS